MLGGLSSGLISTAALTLKLPASNRDIRLGFVGDMFVGAIAAMAAAAMFTILNFTKLQNADGEDRLLGLIAFGIVSGFTGMRLLQLMSSQLLEKLQDRVGSVEKQTKCFDHRIRGNELLDKGRLQEAEHEFLEALKQEPHDEQSLIGLAKVQFRVSDRKAAISTLNRLLLEHPDNARALYNRACYTCADPASRKGDILTDLALAISLNPAYVRAAQRDKDFDRLRGDPEFDNLVPPAANNPPPAPSENR